jgi:hypothetical protein
MRKLAIVAVLFGAATVALAARPGSEFQLLTQLNGQPLRWTMPDGGASGIHVAAANACMPIFGAKMIQNSNPATPVFPSIIMFIPPTNGMHVCLRPSTSSTYWDGGCNAYYPSDLNYGMPVAQGVPQYITPDNLAAAVGLLCVAGDAGSIDMPVWWAQ